MAVNYDQEKQELTRRNFLSLTTWGLVGVGTVGALGVFGRFFWPNVSYGPPSKFSIGKPSNFPDGAKQNIADQKSPLFGTAIRSGRSRWSASISAARSQRRLRATTARATAPSTTTWAMSPTAPRWCRCSGLTFIRPQAAIWKWTKAKSSAIRATIIRWRKNAA